MLLLSSFRGLGLRGTSRGHHCCGGIRLSCRRFLRTTSAACARGRKMLWGFRINARLTLSWWTAFGLIPETTALSCHALELLPTKSELAECTPGAIQRLPDWCPQPLGLKPKAGGLELFLMEHGGLYWPNRSSFLSFCGVLRVRSVGFLSR